MNFFSRTDPDQNRMGFQDLFKIHYSGSKFANSYETLVNNLQIQSFSHKLNSILVTSTQPLEGKTTIATNLAVALMVAKKNILLIDADLRNPQLHTLFGLENRIGFANILAGLVKFEEPIQKKVIQGPKEDPSSYELSVICGGQSYPRLFKMFGSQKVDEFLRHYETIYDMIILDSPPIQAFSDSLTMAAKVKGVILVLNTGKVTEMDAEMTKNQVEWAGGKILGVVLNNFDEKSNGKSLQNYYGYHNIQK